MSEPIKRIENVGPMDMEFREWHDGSVGVRVMFVAGRRQIAELSLLNMTDAMVAARAIVDGTLSQAPQQTELEYEVSQHFSIEYDATLEVHDADGPAGWRYKVVEYPPDAGRWALARIYAFGTERVGPCPMEGRVRSVSLGKWLADAMVRHWRK